MPTIFSYIKSPEKNRAKRQRQLEKYEAYLQMKVKRLRAALSESDKENVGETESQYEAELKSMSGTNEEVRNDEQNVKGHEEVQAVSDEISQVDEEYLPGANEHQNGGDVMVGDPQNVSEHQNQNVPKLLAHTECQTDMVEVAEAGLQSVNESQRTVGKECRIVLTADKECQTEDVVILSSHQPKPFDQDDMRDDKKVKHYTGITNLPTLLLLLKFLLPEMKSVERSLSNFQQIVMVLMKLRLNLEEVDLAYRFNVSQSTISRMFKKWISYMGHKLSPLIRWPCRDELTKTLPMAFRNFFSKCVCIIDCTEIFIDRPSDLKARCQIWSNYKQHNTIKILHPWPRNHIIHI